VEGLEIDDRGWPVVVVHRATAGAEPSRLLHRLDGVLERGEAFGLVFDLTTADRGAGVLVETALAERSSTMAARCVGAATVVRTEAGASRRFASHPVLFPFPSVATSSVEEAVAWLADQLKPCDQRTRT
jgi:hypothetical protein